MPNIKAIADNADMIVSGYAFTKDGEIIRVLNLESPDKALVINLAGEMLETSMDDIEIEIVTDIYAEPEILGGSSICLSILISRFADIIYILHPIV